MNSYAENFPVNRMFQRTLKTINSSNWVLFFKKQSFLLYIIYIHLKKKKIFIELYVILWKAKYNPWFSRL